MLQKYKFGFDLWGLLLFLVIMTPNFIWFAIPAPNDILRADSVTEFLDTIASVCQVLMVVTLCLLIRQDHKRLRLTPLITLVIICCVLYFASWIIYYQGTVNIPVILGLTLFPCLAFMLFAIDRGNLIAVIPISLFTLCHLLHGIVNFMV